MNISANIMQSKRQGLSVHLKHCSYTLFICHYVDIYMGKIDCNADRKFDFDEYVFEK